MSEYADVKIAKGKDGYVEINGNRVKVDPRIDIDLAAGPSQVTRVTLTLFVKSLLVTDKGLDSPKLREWEHAQDVPKRVRVTPKSDDGGSWVREGRGFRYRFSDGVTLGEVWTAPQVNTFAPFVEVV